MSPSSIDFLSILKTMVKHRVDFIVVGGVCAVMHGVPFATYDLDLVRGLDDANIAHLLKALNELDAMSRLHSQVVRANASHLSARGHVLLKTRFGNLDLLGSIGANRDYCTLLEHTVEAELDGFRFRLLDLPTLILTKEETGRDKDLATLPILRAALNQKRR